MAQKNLDESWQPRLHLFFCRSVLPVGKSEQYALVFLRETGEPYKMAIAGPDTQVKP